MIFVQSDLKITWQEKTIMTAPYTDVNWHFVVWRCSIGKCQNWIVSELDSVRIEKCQNWIG